MTKRLKQKKPRWGVRIVLVLSLISLLSLFWCDQNLIQTEVIYVSGAPEEFAELRIALISDVHGKEFGQDNKTLLEKTAELEPDLIAVTGDLIHDEKQLAMVPALAKGLSAIAPTYYVTGNHEWAARCVNELKTTLRECGVTVLSNEYDVLEAAGVKLAILGIDDPNGRADQKTLAELSQELRWNEGEDCYQLLLAHRNNRHDSYSEAMMDLTLSGHAHGGMIRPPFTDGLISPGPDHWFFPSYTNGRYDLDYGQIVVSRGLGSQFPTFRVLNRPHLPLIVLSAD